MPPLPSRLTQILNSASELEAPSRDECAYLLSLPPDSLEAATIRAVADQVSRRRFQGNGLVMGQIGIDVAPCPGKCLFCAFGEEHTDFGTALLPLDEIAERARLFTADGNLHALFLMTMHTFDFGRLLDAVDLMRRTIPAATRVVVNIGDFTRSQAEELKAAGISGAYHVRRLREGTDTDLDPEQRIATISAIKGAELDWYYCCEPIGPEMPESELVDQIFLGIEFGAYQHAAMRRVHLPNSPLARFGQITELRLAQVVAVVALASLAAAETTSIAVHEPNLLGLISGANALYAETGVNPRDTARDTSGSRGLDTIACREMLWEAGFTSLIRGDGSITPLAS